MNVGTFLKEKGEAVLTLHENDSVLDAAAKFGSTVGGQRFSVSFVVDDAQHVLGVLSLGDIVHALAEHREKILGMTAGQIMSKTVYTASLQDSLLDVLKEMVKHEVRHVPAVDNGVLKGIVARKDVLEVLHGEAAEQLSNLTQYVYRPGGRY